MVTGGTGALGRAVCAALLEYGADVHATYVLDSDAEWMMKSLPRVRLHRVDLADAAQVHEAYSSLPSLAASIHCAGGFVYGSIADTNEHDIESMWKINAVTTFNACKEAVRVMRHFGQGGRIVNVAGRPALEPASGFAAYAMSKAAVCSLTRTLSVELDGEGILVNAVVPSIIDTPANRAAMKDADLSKWVTPIEIAARILALASPDNTSVTGRIMPVYSPRE